MATKTFQVVCFCLTLTLCFYRGTCDSNELRDVGNRFFEWRMKERPLQATKRNIYTYNDKLEQFSMEKMEDDKVMADKFLAELDNITISDLKEDERIQYQILRDLLETFIEGYDFKDYALNPVNFLDGLQTDPNSFVGALPFNTIGDYENYIARLKQIPEQLRQFDRLMLEAVRKNKTLHRVSIEPVLGQIQLLLGSEITKSAFFAPFNKMKQADISRTMWSKLRHDSYEEIGKVIKAYRQFHDWIRTTYLPRTRRSTAVDKEYYKACLRWYTSEFMTPEEIHQEGEKEVERIKEKMNEIIERQNFNGTIAEYFEGLRGKPEFFKVDPNDVMNEFRTMITERIDPVLPKMFKELPKYDITVVPMASDGPAGMYGLPSPDGSRPGRFYVNVMRPKEMPVYTFMALALHEASPGHHLQMSLAMAADTPLFMRNMEYPNDFQIPYAFPYYTAFVEGWALYAESLGEEFGIFKDDYEMMGRYSSEIFRAGRMVVDTGLHYYGWDRERAIEYLQNITSSTRPFIEIEVDRYITWPGQAVTYKIGEMTIKKLRKLAEDTLGDDFDLREFHSVVLANGYKPLSLLRESVKAWTALSSMPKECESSRASDVTPLTSCVLLTLITFVYAHFFSC